LRFWSTADEGEGCVYRLRINGREMAERKATAQGFEMNTGTAGLAAGPYAAELWVERKAGAGSGNCQVSNGTYEAYEVTH
jgi:hypothetical protein